MLTKALGEGSLARAIASLAVGNLVARGIGLAGSFVVAALLVPEDFGRFALLASSAAVLGVLGSLGFAPLTTRAIAAADGEDASREAASRALAVAASILTVVGLIVLVAAHWRPWGLSVPGARGWVGVVAVVLWAFGLGLNPILAAVATGRKGFGMVAMVAMTRAVAVALGTCLGCAVWESGDATAMGAAFGEVGSTLIFGTAFRQAGWIGGIPRALRVSVMLTFLAGGVASGAAGFMIQISMWAGQIMLSDSEDGLVGSAAFLLASRLLLAVVLIPNAIATAVLPIIAERQQGNRMPGATVSPVRLAAWTSVPGAAAVFGFGAFLLPVLDASYGQYRGTLLIMCGVGVVVALNNVMGSVAIAQRHVKAWVASDWVLGVVLLAVAVVLVPHAGAPGLAVSYVFAYSTSVFTLFLLTRRSAPSRGGE